MLTLEILSTNRNLKDKLKEVEDMLRDIRYEDLPSYEIGMQRGMQKGKLEGILEGEKKGKLESAVTLIRELNIPIDVIAQKLNISKEMIENYLKKDN